MTPIGPEVRFIIDSTAMSVYSNDGSGVITKFAPYDPDSFGERILIWVVESAAQFHDIPVERV